jgi:hypothetical protein
MRRPIVARSLYVAAIALVLPATAAAGGLERDTFDAWIGAAVGYHYTGDSDHHAGRLMILDGAGYRTHRFLAHGETRLSLALRPNDEGDATSRSVIALGNIEGAALFAAVFPYRSVDWFAGGLIVGGMSFEEPELEQASALRAMIGAGLGLGAIVDLGHGRPGLRFSLEPRITRWWGKLGLGPTIDFTMSAVF